MAIQSQNPFTGEIIQTYEEYSPQRIEQILSSSAEAIQHWSHTRFSERAVLMYRCAKLLIENKEKYAQLMAMEMGKVLREGVAEIEKCASACLYYADHAENFLANKPLEVPDGRAYIQHQPIGGVLAIMPWNFPFWQVFRFAAPNLMAGNVALLKHASNVPQCALAIEEVFRMAGFPEAVFQTLLVSAKSTEKIIAHSAVRAVTLTGSEAAGKMVASVAGKHLKKTVLELGGSDVFVVLKDANLDLAVEMAVKSRMVNSGQSCIAAKRFIVHQDLYGSFLEAFSSKLLSLNMGDPFDGQTDYGPMASTHLAEELEQQVKESIQLGAKAVLPLKRNAALFQPCVLTDLKPNMPAYYQELFGPVACVWRFKHDDEAIRLSNDAHYGLGGSVWGETAHAEQVASQIASGAVYVNRMMASHPAVPFGGIKNSGYGRELSQLGILEFVNQKSIWLA